MNTKEILKDWGSVNDFLKKATEKEAEELLKAERAGANRLAILIRLYGRYNKLRTIRERTMLAKGATS